MSVASSQPSPGFLSFNSAPPRIWITGSSTHAPERELAAWKDEGFETTYLPYTPGNEATYNRTLKTLHNDLKLGEKYAIVAYGDAANVVLRTAIKPMPHCCAIVAYYPSQLPSAKFKFPSSLQVQIHVAGLSQASPPPELCEWKLYRYDRCATGFADPSAKTYSAVEANLAWSRALACMRKGFKAEVDIEPVVEAAWTAKYKDDVPERGSMAVVKSMTQNSPHVTVAPTLEGGIGRRKLEEFYREFFIPSLVEDFELRLVSRTIGVDRVVDEMVVSFTHSDEVDWILPGVPATGKHVEVAMVSVVVVRGGKLVSEHLYWDQASVLVQVGLLDPKVVPKNMKTKGLKRLPAVGVEAARQIVEPRQERYNSLLKEHGLFNGINGVNGVNGS
ncbi:dienelactone hydrolase [Lentithecium fluviatile CBS 122367]|uniref:Dienelactone hydrolase n=1 Tax=Lentithecium fluviatile CBS 122367 TaxID=1168545 RepID=A0A6G1JAQ8_9PLEO|nr:dienelactone hydrolase [Lentithecium fluviatile CBS 122367]